MRYVPLERGKIDRTKIEQMTREEAIKYAKFYRIGQIYRNPGEDTRLRMAMAVIYEEYYHKIAAEIAAATQAYWDQAKIMQAAQNAAAAKEMSDADRKSVV